MAVLTGSSCKISIPKDRKLWYNTKSVAEKARSLAQIHVSPSPSTAIRLTLRREKAFTKEKERTGFMKRRMIIAAMLVLVTVLTACAGGTAPRETGSEYAGINVASPDWVAELDAAKDAQQLFIVAAFDSNATDAWISLHERQSDGTWRMVMTTPGFIGKNGLGKTREGDAKTPT